jgi:ankyrin repeat protein
VQRGFTRSLVEPIFYVEDPLDPFFAACARNDQAALHAWTVKDLHLDPEAGTALAEFAGNANTEGVRNLLDRGVPVNALYSGDPYFDIARDSTALHVAAWRAWPETVKLLIARGAPINALDAKGRTPLALAVKACVDSFWSYRRSPESVKALLEAGATTEGIKIPSGYDEVDALLRQYSG